MPPLRAMVTISTPVPEMAVTPVAVTVPDAPRSSAIRSEAAATPASTVAAKFPAVIPALDATVERLAADPVAVVTALASIATDVIASIAIKSAAAADASVTVTVRALFELASVSVFKVARSPSPTDAVITPVVSASRMFNCATLAVPELTVGA